MSNRSQRGAGYAVEGQVDLSTVNDRDTGIEFPSDDRIQLYAGGVAVQDLQSVSGSDPVYGPMVIKIGAVTGASGSSGVFDSTANPFGYDVAIIALGLNITTQSTGASTLDIGVGPNASTSDDGLIDGLSGAAAGNFSAAIDGGTNGKGFQTWSTSQFLNVAEASGDVDSLIADMYVTCVRL